MENINLIAFGTFGSPNGFTQTFFLGKPIKGIKAFDIRGGLKILPNSKVYSIRKESVNGFDILSYSIYTFAQEPTSSRGGSFIGSSILYVDKISDENITIKNLIEFHQNLVDKNVNDETIKVKHSDDFDVKDCKPKDFNKINYHLKDIENITFSKNTNKELVVFSDIDENTLQQNFKKSYDLLNIYDTIYFTNNEEIAKFVIQKGIYKLIQNVGDKRDFDREINNLIEERKSKRELSISEFEGELQRISEDKKRAIQELKTQIEQSNITHQANNKRIIEAEGDINKINQCYDKFISETNNLIGNLKNSNAQLEEFKNIHNENKKSFKNNLPDLIIPNYVTTIAKPKPKSNLHTENQRQNNEHKNGHSRREEREDIEEKAYKIDIFKVATLVLACLLIVTWVYFLFFKSNSENKTQIIQSQEQVDTIPQEQKPDDIVTIVDLNPKSNSILNENDFRIVAKNLKPNMKSDEVVKVIFNKNPTEIGSIYSGQEAIYSKQLIELNKQCFEEKDGLYYFTKDTIKHIPTFKK
ncbi:hypothetical protein EKM01_11580 [Flavobacterium sp. RSP46]|uniref:hypothetical protein n=1 Tax=Flavobacterium sp. RSP46 TaxID=2497486 RepID=UPI000F88A810|nr:hypothetical protein [Flavobacterium sp. RSP46]RTY90113.1 hypothetical protein EKM01_11580 [Flavobacterium sp. RSP46]